MKKFIALLLPFVLFLSGCALRPATETSPETTVNIPDTTVTVETTTVPETTEADTTITEEILPCFVGLYDDLEENGTYTRLYDWSEPWVMGTDIAVFDIIPSPESTLKGDDYGELWKKASKKISKDKLVKPYLVLEYSLSNGSSKSIEIRSYEDAEKIIKEGFLEVYLYDDVHQEKGAFYSHLTKYTTNDETVITSVKITAGKSIESVVSIRITAYVEGSSGASVDFVNGKPN